MIDSSPGHPERRLEWLLAEVRQIVVETSRVSSLRLEVTGWEGHLAGQHVDVRLTAEDGYQAQRSYSIASPPEDDLLTLTVERLDNGEVSPYLVGEARRGDHFQLRGPIGRYFVWSEDTDRPLQLIAGGAGVAPLMSMLRHRERRQSPVPALLLYSSRSLEDVIYREELDAMARRDRNLRVVYTLTARQPEGWLGYRRRIDKALLAASSLASDARPQSFICGPTPFVESVSSLLVDLGHDPMSIKTERFGPTGGG
ncbi:MAG TPA: ferredoxin reductase [Thermoanaerobaculia bacterium]